MARARVAKRREGNEIEFSRIVAFSDGVFAIAITLLVLNLGIAKGLASDEVADALWDQRENLLAFAISFAVIGRFWLVHHRFFGEVVAFDSKLIGLNLLYLGWIVLLPFSSDVLGEYGDTTAGVVLYSVNLVAVVVTGGWMAARAQRDDLTSIDEESGRENRARWVFIASVFLISIPVAFLSPSAATIMWLVLFFDPSGRIASRATGARG